MSGNPPSAPPPRRLTIALAGNPNAGKTSIFTNLTGTRQTVGNWPGVTGEKKEGRIQRGGRELAIVDLPGTYSLTPLSIEGVVARNFVLDERPAAIGNQLLGAAEAPARAGRQDDPGDHVPERRPKSRETNRAIAAHRARRPRPNPPTAFGVAVATGSASVDVGVGVSSG